MEESEPVKSHPVTALPTDETLPEDVPDEYCDILAELESVFANRYTKEDPNFQAYLDAELDPPPIIDNYYGKNTYKDNRNYQDQNRGYKRRHDDRQYNDNRDFNRRQNYRQNYDQNRTREGGRQGSNQQYQGHQHYQHQQYQNQRHRQYQDERYHQPKQHR